MALKDFTAYAKATTERIANNARRLVTDAGRPVISFDHVKTRNRTQHKDELAKSIAEADGITEGIICLISAVKSCFSFQVRKRYQTGRLELFRRERKSVPVTAGLVRCYSDYMHTCPDFQTTPEFLDVHRQQAAVTPKLIGRADANGQFRLASNLRRVQDSLDRIIPALENLDKQADV